ncbi:MAG TPA: hypothetical protein VK348_13835 [Planctomycetota bacterium]|nr:hypothetical protein [Planctomycetota bacterium]
MNSALAFRALALATALVGSAGVVLAQVTCFQSNFGTVIGNGDDVLLPIQPIGFHFPFGTGTYSDVHVSTNGFFYLSNHGNPAPGTANCCNVTVANLINGPKICPFWIDLVVDPINNGNCFIDHLTGPTRTVITWANAVEFGLNTLMTIQCQLYATGEIVMSFSPSAGNNSGNTLLTGCSPGTATAPPAVDLSASPTTTVPTVFQTFGFNQFDVNGRSLIFRRSGGGYIVDASTCIAASNTPYGNGCYRNFISFYQDFGTSPLDLANSSILMTPSGGGYLVSSGSSSFFTPVAADLALDDDGISAGLLLPFTLAFPGGSTTHVQVCADGYILLQDGTSDPFGGEFLAESPALLNELPRLCPAWHDWRPASAGPGNGGAGTIHYDVGPGNTAVYVTYNGIGESSGAGGSSTFQVAIFNSGAIEFRYHAFNYTDPNAFGMVVGFSQGGGALDPGNRDLSLSLPFNTQGTDGPPPLTADVSPPPVFGTVVTLTTSNVPAAALVTASFLSFGQVSPGLDLGSLGAPGCLQLLTTSPPVSMLLFGSPTVTRTLTIPTGPVWVGVQVYTQSASLVPGVNALGLLTSNGVRMRFNSF